MPKLIALDMPGGPGFVAALRHAWDAGNAVLPVDQRWPLPTKQRILSALAPDIIVDATGTSHSHPGRPVEHDDALVVASSGTTGTPKGIVLTHAAVEASARATSQRIGVRPDDHWLACLPLAHIGGLSVVTRALCLGVPLTVLPRFDDTAVDAAVDRGATLVSLVVATLSRVRTERFRVIVLGGSRPPPDRPANVLATYGMTETGSGIVYNGIALPGVELRVDDNQQIHVRGPMLLRCYRDETVPLDADGWFPTGDLGSFDGTTLQVFGRADDLIITGGENVWPESVEAALGSHPDVVEAGVAGRPDPMWGNRVVAWVVTRDDATVALADVRDHVRGLLPAYCAPHELIVCSTIPRTALGKIQRNQLRTSDE